MRTKFQTDRQRRPDPYKSWAPPSVYDPRQVENGGSSSLRDTPLREDEPAPPRGAVMAVGSPAPQRTPPPPSPNPTKEADAAAVRATAQAAVLAEQAREDPAGQASNQKPAPPPTDFTRFPVPSASVGGKEIGPTPTMLYMPDGSVRFVTAGERSTANQAGGGRPMSHQAAMESAGLGAPQAERFMRGRSFRETSRSEGQPYSEQVRALGSEGPDLSFEGDVGFGTSPPGSGGPSGGSRRLSGIEQAVARRTWLEGRADTEQARETERAELDRRERLAEMDPLEMARIQAQGRMGGDLAKTQLDLRARQAAVQEHERMSRQIEVAQAAMSEASPEDAAELKQYIDYLIQTRREISNLLLGERLTDPRGVGDALGQAIAGLGLAGGGAAPTSGAR